MLCTTLSAFCWLQSNPISDGARAVFSVFSLKTHVNQHARNRERKKRKINSRIQILKAIQRFLKNSSKGIHIFSKWIKTRYCYKIIQSMRNGRHNTTFYVLKFDFTIRINYRWQKFSKRRGDFAARINLYSVYHSYKVDPINDIKKHEGSLAERLLTHLLFLTVDSRSTYGIDLLRGPRVACTRLKHNFHAGNKRRMSSVQEKFKLSRTEYTRTFDVPHTFSHSNFHAMKLQHTFLTNFNNSQEASVSS